MRSIVFIVSLIAVRKVRSALHVRENLPVVKRPHSLGVNPRTANRAQCDNFSIMMTVATLSGGLMSTTYRIELMDSLLQKDEAFDDTLFATLNSFKNYIQAGNQMPPAEMMICEYDPFESAYVPDVFILKKRDQYQDRVFHMPFVEDDRFAVRLEGSCEGVTK